MSVMGQDTCQLRETKEAMSFILQNRPRPTQMAPVRATPYTPENEALRHVEFAKEETNAQKNVQPCTPFCAKETVCALILPLLASLDLDVYHESPLISTL